MANSSKHLSTLEILWKALLLPSKNIKLFLPLFLITFLSTFIFFTSLLILVLPLLSDLTLKLTESRTVDPSSPEFAILISAIKKDITSLLVDESVEVLLGFIVNSLLMIITLYATVTTCYGRILSLVEVLKMAKNTIKGPIVTQLWVSFLNIACSVLFVLMTVFAAMFIARNSLTLSILPIILIILLALGVFLYYSFVWSLSIVISVAEVDCYGLKAISRAGELIKGRKKKGFLLILLMSAFGVAIQIMVQFAMTHASISKGAILVLFGILYALVLKILELFILAIMTVFYSECKKSHGKEGFSVIGERFGYSRLSTASDCHVDNELP